MNTHQEITTASLNSPINLSDITSSDFQNATGPIRYGMTNDYMFRAVLQSNEKVLRGLICSLLHLQDSDIRSIQITNPIILGESIEDKEFRLDINLILNDNTMINLEMQVINRPNWKSRSTAYLCRSYDQLQHGQDYQEAKPVIHISFLDFTLFPECPEFYATYKLINVKNHQIYDDNLRLSVVDLTQIQLATAEDKQYQLDYWAVLFKAKTWEEIKMLSEKNEAIKEAAGLMYLMSEEARIQKRCRDREDYYQDIRTYEHEIAKRDDIISQKDIAITQKDAYIAKLEAQLAEARKGL